MATVRSMLEAKEGQVFQISPSASVPDAAREFVEHGISSLVVAEDDRIIGLFTTYDLTRCCAERPDSLESTEVSHYMQRDVFSATADADVDELIRKMVREGFHHVPVSEGGKPIGMITYGDILTSERFRLLNREKDLVHYIRGVY